MAERYANAPSYSEMLAAEARAAALAAEAAVVAAEEARDRAQALLAGLETPAETLRRIAEHAPSGCSSPSESAVRMRSSQSSRTSSPTPPGELIADEFILDVAETGLIVPAQPLPVNLIEFPRELVAARRARPRLEEGPLREGLDDADGQPPLRIFEAEPMPLAGRERRFGGCRMVLDPSGCQALLALTGEERRSSPGLPLQGRASRRPIDGRLSSTLHW